MTYAELGNPERTSAGPPRDAVIAPRRWTWRWPGRRTDWLLLILFVDLQLADVVSTNYALALPGVWEANPLMAMSQAKLGTAWWLPKLAAIQNSSARGCSIPHMSSGRSYLSGVKIASIAGTLVAAG